MRVISQRGEVLDIAKFIAANPELVAVGNAKMNARGDKIGPGGKIVKRREDIAAEYHSRNPKAVKQVSLKDLANEVLQPQQAVEVLAKEQADAAAVARAAAEAERKARVEADLRGPVPDTEGPKKARKISDSE